LEEVVNFGQRPGYIDGYNVAGKTGTAQKIGENGEYSTEGYVVSYIGYAPSYDPRLLVYVIVDEPDLDIAYYGSTITAPIFTEIMQNSLRYLKVPKNIEEDKINNEDLKVILEDYINKSITTSKKSLYESGLVPIIIGNGENVIKQFPQKGENIVKGSNIYLFTVSEDKYIVPNLIGKSLREALEYCSVMNIDVSVIGNGVVIEQSITPGYPYSGGTLEITLKDPNNTTE